MNPRTEALAFRIWRFAQDKGWDVTATEIAGELQETQQRISRVLVLKGWNTRVRKTAESDFDYDYGNYRRRDSSFLVGDVAAAAIGRYTRLADEAPE